MGRDGEKRIDWPIGGKRQAKRKEALLLLLASRRRHITFGPRRHDGEGQTAPPLVPASLTESIRQSSLREKHTKGRARETSTEGRRKKRGEERGKEKILNDNALKLRLQPVVGPVRTVFDHLLGGSEARGPERCLVPMDPEMGIRRVFFSLLTSRCKTHLSWKGNRNMTFSLWFFVITFLTVCLFAWICHLEIRIACFSVLFQVFVMIRFWYFSSRLWLRLLCVYVCFFL